MRALLVLLFCLCFLDLRADFFDDAFLLSGVSGDLSWDGERALLEGLERGKTRKEQHEQRSSTSAL